MFDPMAKDCVVAPAASEALVSNCRYSRESEYSLSKHTQHKLAPELYSYKTDSKAKYRGH